MTSNKILRRKETIVLLFISVQFLEASIKMVLEAKQLLQLDVSHHILKGIKLAPENGIFYTILFQITWACRKMCYVK